MGLGVRGYVSQVEGVFENVHPHNLRVRASQLGCNFQVDAASVSEGEEKSESHGVYQSDEREHVGPRQRHLDQVAREGDEHDSCTTSTNRKGV